MKKLVTIALAALAVNCFAEPANLTHTKHNLVNYHDSGAYINEFKHVVANAKSYLDKRIAENQAKAHPKKLAIVLDIDETSLSNYEDMALRDFGGTNAQINHEIEQGHAPALKPMLQFYNYVKAHKVAVFFVTGRKESQRNVTVQNLTHSGYYQWNGLYLKPMNYDKKSIIDYKTNARKSIEQMGFDILETIGDQQSDLAGGYAEKGYKLPNPYYYLP